MNLSTHLNSQTLDAEIKRNVSTALLEDVGAGDLTAGLIPEGTKTSATVVSRESAVLCGSAWFARCFSELDAAINIDWHVADGARLLPGELICTLKGDARSLLTGERTALNFLQLLSGVATKTRDYVDVVAGTNAQIVDTRKTLPGLRLAQKYAVKCGGGENHRLGLYDAILIKENHILAAGGILAAMQAALKQFKAAKESAKTRQAIQFIQVEVESLQDLHEALEAGARMILLDNMSLDEMRDAVAITAGRALLEASGNISLETLRQIAETGVDRISIGRLTKDVQALDLSMRFQAWS